MQIINVAFGGSLIAHLPEQKHVSIPHKSFEGKSIPHKVILSKESTLFNIFGQTELSIESLHHQAIDRLAPSFEVSAYSEDNVIEAIEMNSHRWLKAVQWHPEMSEDGELFQQKLFINFVNSCFTPLLI